MAKNDDGSTGSKVLGKRKASENVKSQVDEPVRPWQHPSQLADGSFDGRGSNPGPQSHTAWWFLKQVRLKMGYSAVD